MSSPSSASPKDIHLLKDKLSSSPHALTESSHVASSSSSPSNDTTISTPVSDSPQQQQTTPSSSPAKKVGLFSKLTLGKFGSNKAAANGANSIASSGSKKKKKNGKNNVQQEQDTLDEAEEDDKLTQEWNMRAKLRSHLIQQQQSHSTVFDLDEWNGLSYMYDSEQNDLLGIDTTTSEDKKKRAGVASLSSTRSAKRRRRTSDDSDVSDSTSDGDEDDSDEDEDFFMNDAMMGDDYEDGENRSSAAQFMSSKENQYEIQFEQERQRMKEKFDDMTTVMDISSFLQEEFGKDYRQRIVDLQVQTLYNLQQRYCLIINGEADEEPDRVFLIEPNAVDDEDRLRVYKCPITSNYELTRCFMSPNGQHIIVTASDPKNDKQASENFYLSATETETTGRKSSEMFVAHKIEKCSDQITAVAWQPDYYRDEDDEGKFDYDTGVMIWGTASMKLMRARITAMEENSKISYDIDVEKLFELRKLYVSENVMFPLTPAIAIAGVQCISFKYGKRYRSMVMVSTRIGLSIFYADDITADEISHVFDDYQTISSLDPSETTQPKRKPITIFIGEDEDLVFNSDLRIIRRSTIDEFTYHSSPSQFEIEVPVNEQTEDMPLSFAWSTHSGILHGKFCAEPDLMLERATLLPYDNTDLGRPVSVAISEFHIFVAYVDTFHIYMQPPELHSSTSKYSLLSKIVYNSARHLTLNLDFSDFLRFTVDETSSSLKIYLVTDSEIIVFLIEDEPMGMWRLFLEQALDTKVASAKPEYFGKALRLCSDFQDIDGSEDASVQRREVYTHMGHYFFQENSLKKAAECYARTDVKFDDIVIKFMDKDPDDAQHGLYTYLYYTLKRHKLSHPTSSSTTKEITKQAICLCIWIVELLIHKLNLYNNTVNQIHTSKCSNEQYRLQSQAKNKAVQDRDRTRTVLRKFMFQNKDVLESCKAIVYNMLMSNGFMNDFLFFATLIADYEVAIQHCLTMGKIELDSGKQESSYYSKALWILDEFCHEKDKGHDELWYKYSPILMQYHAPELLKCFEDYKILDPACLIPALLRYSHLAQQHNKQRGRTKQTLAQADPLIRYLSHCIDDQKNDEPVIHNLMIYFLAQKMSSELLDSFLRKETDNVTFNKEYALRTCLQFSKYTSCVVLYSMMGLYDEAIDMALMRNDAKESLSIVLSLVEDLELKKKLILKIVKFLIRTDKQRGNLSGRQQSISLLTSGEFDGVLKLDDILKFFPADTNLEIFGEQIRSLLSHYRYNSNQLHLQIREGTNDAELIRADLQSMTTTKDITDDYKCDHCGRPAALEKFYVFPCTHAFHLRCLKEMHIERLRTAKLVLLSAARKDAENKYIREVEKKKRIRMKAERLKSERSGELPHMLQKRLEAIANEPIVLDSVNDLEIALTPEEQTELAKIQSSLEELKAHDTRLKKLKLQLSSVVPHTLAELELELALQRELRDFSSKIADECPYDGTMMIEEICTPIITNDDEKFMEAWKIVQNNNAQAQYEPTTIIYKQQQQY